MSGPIQAGADMVIARGGAARPCARRVKPPGIITDLGRTAATSTLEKSSHTKSNPKI